jgi:hypothetical protein
MGTFNKMEHPKPLSSLFGTLLAFTSVCKIQRSHSPNSIEPCMATGSSVVVMKASRSWALLLLTVVLMGRWDTNSHSRLRWVSWSPAPEQSCAKLRANKCDTAGAILILCNFHSAAPADTMCAIAETVRFIFRMTKQPLSRAHQDAKRRSRAVTTTTRSSSSSRAAQRRSSTRQLCIARRSRAQAS